MGWGKGARRHRCRHCHAALRRASDMCSTVAFFDGGGGVNAICPASGERSAVQEEQFGSAGFRSSAVWEHFFTFESDIDNLENRESLLNARPILVGKQ